VLTAIGVGEVVGVGVAAEPVLGFEKGDVVGAGEQVRTVSPETPAPITATDGRGASTAVPCSWGAEPAAVAGPLARKPMMTTFV
jgi:hypothetical protein